VPTAELPAGDSLYALELAFTTDGGETLQLAELAGQAVIVALLFTRCPSVCPTLVRDLVALDASLPPAQRERTRFVLLSIDPEHDTVAALAAYRARMRLEPRRFLLLRGTVSAVRELAASIGFGYGAEPGALPSHSRLVTLLDARGRIAVQRADALGDREALAGGIARALAGGRDAR